MSVTLEGATAEVYAIDAEGNETKVEGITGTVNSDGILPPVKK